MMLYHAITLASPTAHLPMLSQTPFIHPQFAMAATGMLAIPVLIHLINRRRYKRMPWAAMQFLRDAYKKSSRRMRFEQWLLLLIRMAIIACFGAAIARPFFPLFANSPIRQGRALRIILLDNSASMNATREAHASKSGIPTSDVSRSGISQSGVFGTGASRTGVSQDDASQDNASQTNASQTNASQGNASQTNASRLTRAIDIAIGMIDTFDPSDGVCLYTSTGPNLAVIAEPAYDRRRIRDHLERLAPSQRRSDWDRALEGVQVVLANSDVPEGNRFLYILSDFATTDWLSDSGDTRRTASMQPIARKAKISLIRISDNNLQNVAITALKTESSPAGANQPIRMSANLINHSSTTQSDDVLEVRVDDRIARTLQIEPLPPHESRSIPFSIVSPNPGQHIVSISRIPPDSERSSADGLTQDDHRALAMNIPGRLPVLLVDGRPGSDPYSSATGYLAAALCPFPDEESCDLFAPTIISARDLVSEPLDPFAVVALCDVSRLDETQWTRLQDFTKNGGGVICFAGDRIDLDHWNSHGFNDGEGLLPSELTAFTGLSGSNNAEGLVANRAPRRFANDALQHPIVSVFADHQDGGLFSARVTKSLIATRLSPWAEIVLTYDDKTPAIILHTVGDGRACLVTTSADMTWTNLPAKGDFVALVVNLFTHMTADAGTHRTVTVGQSIRERMLPSIADRVARIEAPDGTLSTTTLELADQRLILNPDPFEQTGLYKIDLGQRTIRVAVNADVAESNLESSTRKQLESALKCDFDWFDAAKNISLTSKTETTEIGDKLLLILLVLLVLESHLAQRFGANR